MWDLDGLMKGFWNSMGINMKRYFYNADKKLSRRIWSGEKRWEFDAVHGTSGEISEQFWKNKRKIRWIFCRPGEERKIFL